MSPPRAPALFSSLALDRPPDARFQGRRSKTRAAIKRATHETFSALAESLSTLNNNFPNQTVINDTVEDSAPATGFLNDKQEERVASKLLSASERYVRRRRQGSAATLSASEPPLNHSSQSHTFQYATARSQAVSLIADRVALPTESSDAIEIQSALPANIAREYARPHQALVGDPAKARSQPAAFLASRIEYARLVRRLISLGMCRLSTHALVVNGLFCVPKDDWWLRLIIDCRPVNAVFADAPSLVLPTPDVLASARIPRDRRIKVAHSDVDNAFHRMRLPAWMQLYFALPALRAADVGAEAEFGADTLVYPLLTRLPMGWSHSPFLCQAVHRHIVLTATRLSADDEISADSDPVVDRPRWFVYLDDFTLLCPEDCDPDAIFSEYLQAMARHGLPAKPSKVEPPADSASSLGLLIDCAEGTIGVAPHKLHALCIETESVLAQREISGYGLSALLGKWTWAMLVRRPALAVFTAVYRFVEAARWRPFRIWPSVKRELRVAMGLVPLLFADLAAPWAPLIVATDASEFGQGVVARQANSAEAEAEAALARKSPASTLTSAQEGELREAAVADGKWSEIVSARWEYTDQHINTFELRAMLTAARWLASRPALLGARVLLLSDSSVAVAAMSKGRSSSYSLLRVLRPFAALCLACGLVVWPRWLPSERNPADAASRR